MGEVSTRTDSTLSNISVDSNKASDSGPTVLPRTKSQLTFLLEGDRRKARGDEKAKGKESKKYFRDA